MKTIMSFFIDVNELSPTEAVKYIEEARAKIVDDSFFRFFGGKDQVLALWFPIRGQNSYLKVEQVN